MSLGLIGLLIGLTRLANDPFRDDYQGDGKQQADDGSINNTADKLK